jgi:hypothetical protein
MTLGVALSTESCGRSRRPHVLAVQNPGATFDVLLMGCGSPGVSGRRFGSNARAALLWSSERVQSASYLPCTATIEAVRGSDRHAVYRIMRTREGAYIEELVRKP